MGTLVQEFETDSRGPRLRLPIRSCIACRKKENWTDLLRIVLVENQVLPDPNHNKPGRGAWLHPNCLDVAVQRRAFARAFKSSTDVRVEILGDFLKTLRSYQKEQ